MPTITSQQLRGMKRPAKYGNRKVNVNGIVFDSQREAARWGELELLARAEEIFDLRRQVPYALHVNGELICTYFADFSYRDRMGGPWIVEDAKGMKTDVYKIKKKLMRACWGIDIREV